MTFPTYLHVVGCFDPAASMQVKHETIQPMPLKHFICIHWEEGGQVHLKEAQSLRGQGETVQSLL